MRDENCIFCKLASHEIPTNVIYEDEDVIAFEDMEPLMPVHSLVIPKEHYADIADGVPDEIIAKCFKTIVKIGEMKGISEGGYRILVNKGDNAS